MRETRWDCVEWNPPNLGVETRPALYNTAPRINYGSYNVYTNQAGSICKRPGSAQWSGVLSGGKQIKKIWLYETLPTPAAGVTEQYSYLLFSVQDDATSEYSLYYKRYDSSATTALTLCTNLRELNTSYKLHHIVFSKGLAYVKAFPTTDKYGTVILDGTSGSILTRPWGLPGPTVPVALVGDVTKATAAITAQDGTINVTSTTGFPGSGNIYIGYEKISYAGTTATSFTGCLRGLNGSKAEAYDIGELVRNLEWDASDHQVTVELGWKYAFAYVSITGQVSNRSDIQRNPDLMPSNTGPFVDLKPKMTLTLDSFFYNDTTTYPTLNMYRTTDGGGTFYFLESVTNPGTSTLTYIDDSFGTGASSTTYADPQPDEKLDTARYAPSLTSNDVPTPVRPPQVIGTDVPSRSCYAMATYVSRIWVGIDNYIFFSSREETRDGIGEECFPSGNLGNFIILDSAIVGMASTSDALYVITTTDVLKLTGSTVETFVINKIASGIGGYTCDTCAKAFRNSVAFITKEKEVAVITGDDVRIISKPLSREFLTFGSYTAADIGIHYYRDAYYEWLIVSYTRATYSVPDSTAMLYVYDILKSEETKTDFWNPPWQPITCAFGSFQSVRSNTSGMFWGIRHSVGGYTAAVKATVPAPSSYALKTDATLTGAGAISSSAFATFTQFGAIEAPTGNHLNTLNASAKDVNFYGVLVTCANASTNTSQMTPGITINNKATNETVNTYEQEPRIVVDDTDGLFITRFFPYNKEVKIIRPYFSSTGADSTDFEIMGMTWMFDPKANP